MNACRVTTALACAPLCAVLTAERANGQDRSDFGPTEPARTRVVFGAMDESRLPMVAEPRRPGTMTTLRSWSVGEAGEVSLGRFRVVDQVRRRTNVERERQPLQMDMETKAIAGAGFRWRF